MVVPLPVGRPPAAGKAYPSAFALSERAAPARGTGIDHRWLADVGSDVTVPPHNRTLGSGTRGDWVASDLMTPTIGAAVRRRTARTIAVLVLTALALAACGEQAAQSPDVTTPPRRPAPEPGSAAPAPGAIWFEVLGVSQESPEDISTLHLVEDTAGLETEWERHRFDGAVPDVDLGQHVVLVVTRPEDGCPDDLVEVRRVDGELRPTFVPPPGGCIQPLIPTAYAIALHRADLGEAATIRFAEHEGHGGDAVHELALAPYDGPPAPPAPDVPQQMTEADLEAVFADHAIRPCAELDDPRAAILSQPLEATPDARMLEIDVPEDVQGAYAAEHADTFGWFMVDQPAATWIVGVTDDVDGHEARLAERHPDHDFRVVETPFTRATLQAAHEAVQPLHGADGPQVTWSSTFAYLEIGVIDPTREDLDAIAAVLDDPSVACVDPDLSGLQPTDG